MGSDGEGQRAAEQQQPQPQQQQADEGGSGEDECEVEARPVRHHHGPRQPSAAEVEAHNVSHQPPRLWCKHCVATRCIASPHPRGSGENPEIPVVSMDYCYPGVAKEAKVQMAKLANERRERGEAAVDDEVPAGISPELIVHDSESSGTFAISVSRKGACYDAVTRVREMLEFLGYPRIILKNDQEPAIVALSQAIRDR